jgi:hypothetical protein
VGNVEGDVMTETREIPAGYLEDAQGRLVPERLIRPHERQRDALVRELISRCEATAASLAATKAALLADVAAHCALVAERYGVATAGDAGNVSLVSYDGRLKVERASADRITIGEEIQPAQALIGQILDEIDHPIARQIAERAFRRDRKTGELSAARLVDLVSLDIDDDRWRRAVLAIREAMRATGTTVYFRAYRRERSDAPWEQIPLDFSAIAPVAAGAPLPRGQEAQP